MRQTMVLSMRTHGFSGRACRAHTMSVMSIEAAPAQRIYSIDFAEPNVRASCSCMRYLLAATLTYRVLSAHHVQYVTTAGVFAEGLIVCLMCHEMGTNPYYEFGQPRCTMISSSRLYIYR